MVGWAHSAKLSSLIICPHSACRRNSTLEVKQVTINSLIGTRRDARIHRNPFFITFDYRTWSVSSELPDWIAFSGYAVLKNSTSRYLFSLGGMHYRSDVPGPTETVYTNKIYLLDLQQDDPATDVSQTHTCTSISDDDARKNPRRRRRDRNKPPFQVQFPRRGESRPLLSRKKVQIRKSSPLM